ncbi:ribonuclease H-like domain-containing protein [Tanacetum coccineum]
MVEKPVLNNKGRVKGQREIRPVWNNAQRVNHQNKLTHPHPKKNFVPTVVATKSGQVPINAAKQQRERRNNKDLRCNIRSIDVTVLSCQIIWGSGESFDKGLNNLSLNDLRNVWFPQLVSEPSGSRSRIYKIRLDKTSFYLIKEYIVVLTAVVTKSGQVPVTAKQSSPRAAASISTVRPVNTDAPKSKVNDASPIKYSYFKAHSPLRRPFNQKSAAKTNNFNKKVNTARVNNVTTAGPEVVVSTAEGKRENAVKSSACWIWRPQRKNSRSMVLLLILRLMTGNQGQTFTDYQEVDGGFVAFAGSPKGRLKLLKMMNVIVLSPDFKLLDESQVLLKVPRQNNMYSFDLKNVVPSGGLTCLFAKAIIDESNLWHRRLGHIKLKNYKPNLVRGNLVRGLPSKLFENDHSCVACQKGKNRNRKQAL